MQKLPFYVIVIATELFLEVEVICIGINRKLNVILQNVLKAVNVAALSFITILNIVKCLIEF